MEYVVGGLVFECQHTQGARMERTLLGKIARRRSGYDVVTGLWIEDALADSFLFLKGNIRDELMKQSYFLSLILMLQH